MSAPAHRRHHSEPVLSPSPDIRHSLPLSGLLRPSSPSSARSEKKRKPRKGIKPNPNTSKCPPVKIDNLFIDKEFNVALCAKKVPTKGSCVLEYDLEKREWWVERMSARKGQIRAGAGEMGRAVVEVFLGIKAVMFFLDSAGKSFMGDEALVGTIYSCGEDGSLVAITDKQVLSTFEGIMFWSVGKPLFINRKIPVPPMSVMWCELARGRVPKHDSYENKGIVAEIMMHTYGSNKPIKHGKPFQASEKRSSKLLMPKPQLDEENEWANIDSHNNLETEAPTETTTNTTTTTDMTVTTAMTETLRPPMQRSVSNDMLPRKAPVLLARARSITRRNTTPDGLISSIKRRSVSDVLRPRQVHHVSFAAQPSFRIIPALDSRPPSEAASEEYPSRNPNEAPSQESQHPNTPRQSSPLDQEVPNYDAPLHPVADYDPDAPQSWHTVSIRTSSFREPTSFSEAAALDEYYESLPKDACAIASSYESYSDIQPNIDTTVPLNARTPTTHNTPAGPASLDPCIWPIPEGRPPGVRRPRRSYSIREHNPHIVAEADTTPIVLQTSFDALYPPTPEDTDTPIEPPSPSGLAPLPHSIPQELWTEEERVWHTRNGNVRRWAKYPPVQIAEEMLPRRMKWMDWRGAYCETYWGDKGSLMGFSKELGEFSSTF